MKKSQILVGIILIAILTGCAKQQNLTTSELLVNSVKCFKETNTIVLTIPSRGLIADSLALTALKTTGMDGGFSKDFDKLIKNGKKQIAIYSKNSLKSSEYLKNTLSKYKNNELKNIGICYMGDTQYFESIKKEIIRVGAFYSNIYDDKKTTSQDLGILPSKSNDGGIMDQIKFTTSDTDTKVLKKEE
jgi:hypothetical protein